MSLMYQNIFLTISNNQTRTSLININFYAYRINAKYHNITEKSTKQLS